MARGRVSFRVHSRSMIVTGTLAAIVLAAVAVALTLGTYTVSLGDVIAALFGDAAPAVHKVVVEWRLPRAIAAAVFGAALGLSGAIFQTLTRNPLGSPDVIGFDMGAFTGVLIVLLAGGSGFAATASGALVGGVATALAVYALAFKRGVQGFRLIIVGIALAAMLTSVNTWVLVKADLDLALSAAVWGAGSLNGLAWSQVLPALALLGLLVMLLWPLAPALRQLELGDDVAALQGLRTERVKTAVIVVGVAFTAVVTAVAGPISFVALAAPQVARRLTGRGASVDLVTSAFVGAALLSLADLIAQHAVPAADLPVGAVTVCLGGLYLVWLLTKETSKR